MSSEIPSEQRNHSEPENSNSKTDSTEVSLLDSQETIQDRAKELAGNIVRLLETNEPNVTKEYFDDLLADTENNFPPSERAVIFELLASEQRNKIHDDLVGCGEKMTKVLLDSNASTRQSFAESESRARTGIRHALEAHEVEVGHHFWNNQSDIKIVSDGHNKATNYIREGFGYVTKHIQNLNNWVETQHQGAKEYIERAEFSQNHERALTEASQALKPDNKREQKNLSTIINEEVKVATITRLQSIITESKTKNEIPEEAVLKFITKNSDINNEKLIEDLQSLVKDYSNLIRKDSNHINLTVEEAKNLINLKNSYQETMPVDKAIDLYHDDRKAIKDAFEKCGYAIKKSVNLIDGGEQALEKMKQNLIDAKTDKVNSK